MPRPRNVVPVPRNHKGRAVLDVYDNGTRRTLTLGAWGSAEAEAEYKRFLAEFATGAFARPTTADVTVNEVLLAFLKHAEQHYRRPDGTTTNELTEYRLSAKVVRELYGHTPAKEFGPLAIKAVRQRMIDLSLCRPVVNRRIGRVKRVFKWAVAEELVPPAVHQAVTAVAGLQRGRTPAREPEPVGPVDDAHVDAVLPFLNRHVRGLVEFGRLTGCRRGEACQVRKLDIDTSGPVWYFRPAQHKTAHRGKPRVILIGPKAQVLLTGFFTDDPADYCFSPRRAMDELRAARAAARKTPRWESHMARNARKRVQNPKRKPAERYNVSSYDHAVTTACEKAGVPRWHPNQLRHTYATRVRKERGLEAAQVVLGHATADITQVYAERDLTLAAEVAAKMG